MERVTIHAMSFSGSLENQPLLDVIQIVAYSQQSGILTLKTPETRGLVIFERGSIVCAYSPSALPLLVKAAKEVDGRNRLSLRRIQILTALRELFEVKEGLYRFVKRAEPVPELEGLDMSRFYAEGALDTGDLLLVLQKAMEDEKTVVAIAEPPPDASELAKREQRRFPRYAPIIIRGALEEPGRTIEGFLTNLSEGGTFFHSDELPTLGAVGWLRFTLPWDLGDCNIQAKVAWLRPDAPDSRGGAGLSFGSLDERSKVQMEAYLERFLDLAEDIALSPEPDMPKGAPP